MEQVRKAVITAAGRGARLYPAADTVQKAMFPVVDRDGLSKPVIQIIAEEALESGIEAIALVVAPGDEPRYRAHFQALRENLSDAHADRPWAIDEANRIDRLLQRLEFVEQPDPKGYGNAVLQAEAFVGSDPFLLLLGDHLYISRNPDVRCAQQLITLAASEGCAASAVQATREHLIARYGTVSGPRYADHTGIYHIERIREKPSISTAELELATPGIRTGHYLCFFGMHVFPPTIFETIREHATSGEDIQLTPALQALAKREKYLAVEVEGVRYDIGGKFGLLETQLAFAANGVDRDKVLTSLVELMADQARRQSQAGTE